MRIAQIAPIIERVPPKRYGGTERIVHALTEELVKRGHDVTLFASGDSRTSATLSSVYPRALREDGPSDLYGTNAWALLNFGAAYARQDEFDVIHDHTGYLSFPTANLATTPVIATLHNPIADWLEPMYRTHARPNLVTISKAQITVPGLNYLDTVYNGLPMEHYPFSMDHDGYLLFVGRISLQKGVHTAIRVAQETQLPLIIAAKLDPVDQEYFETEVQPHLSDTIRWIGEVDEKERNHLMSRAYALVHAVTWPEPFGLTLIEAMACGAPVIAAPMGSIPEIVEHGRTGFVAATVEEMVEAVEKLPRISRVACRQHALTKFNAGRMTEHYERLYAWVIARRASMPRSTLVSGMRAVLP